MTGSWQLKIEEDAILCYCCFNAVWESLNLPDEGFSGLKGTGGTEAENTIYRIKRCVSSKSSIIIYLGLAWWPSAGEKVPLGFPVVLFYFMSA